MMHMALMGNLCMKRLSIIPSHVYMYVCVCVCVCARRSFNSQTPERIQRFAVRVPIGLKIKTTLE